MQPGQEWVVTQFSRAGGRSGLKKSSLRAISRTTLIPGVRISIHPQQGKP